MPSTSVTRSENDASTEAAGDSRGLDPAVASGPASYEAALGELEGLVAAMEAGQLPLDRLLENYRRGAELLGFCRARLEAVEQQVKVVENGQLKPWAPA